MSDKKRAVIIQVDKAIKLEGNAVADKIVAGGNTSLYTLRKSSVTESNGVFNAMSGISHFVGDLADRLRQLEMSRIERKFFGAGLSENGQFKNNFHKEVTAGIYTDGDASLLQHAGQFGITAYESID